MRTLRKIDIESMEKELSVLKNPKGILGGWGQYDNPYPVEVYEYLCSINAFEGGYVDGMEYVFPPYVELGTGDYVVTPTGSVVPSFVNLINDIFRSCSGITGSISSDIMNTFVSQGTWLTYYMQSSVTEFLLDIPQLHYLEGFFTILIPQLNAWNNNSNLNKIVKIESISRTISNSNSDFGSDPTQNSSVKKYGFRISVSWENESNPYNVVSYDLYY